MKAALLLLLVSNPITCLLARPLLTDDRTVNRAAGPVSRGDGLRRPARSSVGAGRVTVHSAQPSRSVNLSTRSSNLRKRTTGANAPNVRAPGTSKPAGAAKSIPRIAAPTITAARHRGPNPATIGGAGTNKATGTGSVSGTGISRRR